MPQNRNRPSSLLCCLTTLIALLCWLPSARAVIRDGGIDPSNLGKGEWIYSMRDATNRLGSTITAVTNTTSLFQYYKSIGVRYVLVKMGTGSTNYDGCSYASPHQVTTALCNTAHSNGVWVFGYTRSYGSDIPGESALATSCFNNGADGFVFDAEAEWETGHSWITNGPAQAWSLMSMVRSNWPTKFLGHAPFPIISLHSTFPYKEFGYWSDAIMPQVYHFSSAGLKGSSSAAMNWSDVNWTSWQNSISGTSSNVNGQVVFWSDAIKPLAVVQDVYGPAGTILPKVICNGTASAYPDKDVMEFIDYVQADPNCVTAGGYNSVNFWRADLHGAVQVANITAGTSGNFTNVVNNIVIDDANASRVGTWTAVKTFSATTSTTTFTGYNAGNGTDTNSFGTNYYTKAQGNGSAYMEFVPTVKVTGDYKVYQWHPDRPDASTAVPFTVSYYGGTATVNANQTTNGGNWSFVGQFPFSAGTNGSVRVYDNFPEAGSIAMVDGLKMVFVTPTSTPTAPSLLTASTVSSSQIDLSWHDNASNESGFVIGQSTSSGGPYSDIGTAAPNATNFSATALNGSTTYYFVVRAVNYLGNSANSAQASATTFLAGGILPSITSQPQNQTVTVGSSATFSVTSIGTTPLVYQWRFGGTNISAATNSTYTRTNSQFADAGNYSVVITNAYGSAISSNATLTVTAIPPSITSQPQSTTNNAGTTASFTVSATGTAPLGYQWKKNGSPLNNGGNVTGSTTTTLTLTAVTSADAADYSVTITNAGGTATSTNATLVVNSTPSIISQPASQTNSAGSTAIFTVSASGSQPLSYQWSKNGTNLVSGGNISGATSTSLTITSVSQSDAANYTVVVTNSLGSVTSSSAALIVVDPPGITTQPVSRTNNAATLATFSVAASGTSPAFQWLKNGILLANSGNVSGAKTATLNLASVTQSDASNYSVIVSNSAGNVTSIVATLTVITPPSLNTQPQNQTVSVGGNVSFSVSASGSSPLSYRWRFNGVAIAAATDSTYTKNNLQTNDAGNYSVVITNVAGSVTSSNATVVVNVGQTRAVAVSNLWNIPAESRSYVTSGNTERGIAFNTASNHVLIVSRALNANGNILAVDADTGTDLGLSLNTTTISGGTIPLNKIGVTTNGIIYAANVTTASGTTPFKIYRWTTYSGTPTVAYTGAPDNGATLRWGDAFAVRGSGTGTQILVAGSSSTNVIVFTTTDGSNFTPKVITPSPAVVAGALGKGLSFGSGNTFYMKNRTATTATNYSFDLTTGTATVGSTLPGLDGSMIAIGIDTGHQLLCGVIDDGTTNNSGHLLKTFDIANPASPTLVTTFNFPTFGSGTNSYLNATNLAGHVDTDGTNFVGLDTQNGVVALRFNVQISPSITTQPQDQNTPQGQNAVFTVASSGTTPLAYQWKKDGVNLADTGNVSGATTANLTIATVAPSDEADYTVTVSNGIGAADSTPATLTVIVPPSITTQPQPQTANAGDSATFSVSASGSGPLYYQWKNGGTALVDGTNVFGATSSSLVVANVSQSEAADYSVVVTNGAGTVTSSTAHLTVIDPPTITANPAPQTLAAGATATFNASASGLNLSYQWKKNGITIADSASVSGSTTATLTLGSVSQADVADYSVLVSNSAGSSASTAAHLTVIDAPSISTPPSSRTNNPNTTATFTVTATGQNLVYRWSKNSNPLVDGANVSGATSATLTLGSVTQNDAADYSVTVTNIAGSQTSSSAHLTIVAPPVIISQPTSTTNNPGETATFSVSASSMVSVTYQWKKNNAMLIDNATVSGTTSATLTIANVSSSDTADYSVTVSNSAGATNSSSAHLKVNTAPLITDQPISQVRGLGTNVILTVTASGTPPLSYQWKKDAIALANGGNISGVTSSNLTILRGSDGDNGNYSVAVSNSAGNAVSDVATVTFISVPVITAQPTGQTNAIGSPALFSVAATGTNLNYQWKKDGVDVADSGVDGGHLSGATSETLTIPSIDGSDSGGYQVVVSNEAGSVGSGTALLKVLNPPVILAHPVGRTNAVNTTATFAVSASGSSLIYQWRKDGLPLTNGTKIKGATNALLTLSGLTSLNSGDYSVAITNPDGSTVSADAHLEVLAIPSIVVQPQNSTNPSGSTVTLTVSASGVGLQYQWKKGGIAMADNYYISGVTSPALTLNGALVGDSASYTVVVSNVVGSILSKAATLKVIAPPIITAQPQSRTNASGTIATFSVMLGGTTPLAYQWKKDGLALTNSPAVSGANTATLTLTGVSIVSAGSYSVDITNFVGSAASIPASLTVFDAIAIVSQPMNITNSIGSTATFNVQVSGTNPQYQWRKGTTILTDGGNISGATSDTLQIQNLQYSDAGTFSVVVSNAVSKQISMDASLTMLSAPIFLAQPMEQKVVYGSNAIFSVQVAGTSPLGYQWKKDGTNLVNGGRIIGATSSSLTIAGAINSDEGNYFVTVSNSVDSLSSDSAPLTIVPFVNILKPTANAIVVSGNTNITGTASDHVGVTQVLYSWNNGPFVPALGTTNWITPVLIYSAGTNVVAVKSINSAGRESKIVNRSFFYPVAANLTLITNGIGTMTPNLAAQVLYVGRNYTIAAAPGVGQLFSNWTGTYSTNAKTLTFLMQPNVTLTANFVTNLFIPRAGTYTGLFYETNQVTHESSGLFKFVLTSTGTYSGQFYVGGVSRAMMGQFDLSGKSHFVYNAGPQVAFDFDLMTDLGISDRVIGSVSNANWNAEAAGDRVVYNTSNTTSRAGRYLVALSGSSDGSLSPTGDGYAIITVNTNGAVSVAGNLSEGTSLMQGTFISKNGQLPLYVPLYATKGSVLGWLTVTNRIVSSVEGDVSWIKKNGTSSLTYYADGFTNDLVAIGSTFSLTNGVRGLDLTNGVAILGSGDLPRSITNTISLTIDNAIITTPGQPDSLLLTLNTNTGIITGTFFDRTIGAKVSVKGVLLQQQNSARGYFLSPPNHVSGSFLIDSN